MKPKQLKKGDIIPFMGDKKDIPKGWVEVKPKQQKEYENCDLCKKSEKQHCTECGKLLSPINKCKCPERQGGNWIPKQQSYQGGYREGYETGKNEVYNELRNDPNYLLSQDDIKKIKRQGFEEGVNFMKFK